MRRFVAIVAVGTALAAATVSFAAETDRVHILPRLEAAVTTLPDFTKTGFDGDAGGWVGPRCDVLGSPSLSRETTITWGLGQYRAATAEAAMQDALTFDWPVGERGTLNVPHVIGQRQIGVVRAAFVVTDSGGDLRRHESAFAVRLAPGLFLAGRFWASGPPFACSVAGESHAVYFRRVARAALDQVDLEGSLPPARVTARRVGRRVAGFVRDTAAHPVVGITVVIERRVGGRWRKAASGRTGASGAYSVAVGRRGLYRAVATVERISARSAAVRVR